MLHPPFHTRFPPFFLSQLSSFLLRSQAAVARKAFFFLSTLHLLSSQIYFWCCCKPRVSIQENREDTSQNRGWHDQRRVLKFPVCLLPEVFYWTLLNSGILALASSINVTWAQWKVPLSSFFITMSLLHSLEMCNVPVCCQKKPTQNAGCFTQASCTKM